MGGICNLAFEKQDWDFVSFLVCVTVFDMYYCFGYLFCFDFHCSYRSIGQFSWAMCTQTGTYFYTPVSTSVYSGYLKVIIIDIIFNPKEQQVYFV
jgi:hypothetical protein